MQRGTRGSSNSKVLAAQHIQRRGTLNATAWHARFAQARWLKGQLPHGSARADTPAARTLGSACAASAGGRGRGRAGSGDARRSRATRGAQSSAAGRSGWSPRAAGSAAKVGRDHRGAACFLGMCVLPGMQAQRARTAAAWGMGNTPTGQALQRCIVARPCQRYPLEAKNDPQSKRKKPTTQNSWAGWHSRWAELQGELKKSWRPSSRQARDTPLHGERRKALRSSKARDRMVFLGGEGVWGRQGRECGAGRRGRRNRQAAASRQRGLEAAARSSGRGKRQGQAAAAAAARGQNPPDVEVRQPARALEVAQDERQQVGG